jgi:protein involved in polysaccharide export with SLBB domain
MAQVVDSSPSKISENPPSGAALEAQQHYDAGMTLYDSGNLNDALTAFKQADRLKPDDPHTKYMLGMVYSKSKSFKDAADSFKQAVRFKPDWPEAQFKLGTMFYVLGRRSQSLEAYKKLLELDPPLANRLYGIIKGESNAVGRAENVALESKGSAKQIEAVPVSASAKETPVSAGNPTRTAAGTKPVWSAPANPAPRSETPAAANSNRTAAETKPVWTTPANPAPRSETNDPAPGLGSARATSGDSALSTVYKIGVGDVLDIRLLNSTTSRSTLYSVIDGGLIDFPIAGGPVSVAGLTVDEIQARIASELKRRAVEEGAHVSVGVRQYASHTVIITGLVGNPGTKMLRREAVPLYVIMADAQPRADAGRLAIMRAGATEQFLDLSDPGALNFTVRPGDVINVTARPQEFYYIAGRINYPGQKVFQPGITLLQAILAAGGMTHENVNAIELSRERADGRLATTKFNLKEIKAGKVQDPRLQPGDRIEVVR